MFVCGCVPNQFSRPNDAPWAANPLFVGILCHAVDDGGRNGPNGGQAGRKTGQAPDAQARSAAVARGRFAPARPGAGRPRRFRSASTPRPGRSPPAGGGPRRRWPPWRQATEGATRQQRLPRSRTPPRPPALRRGYCDKLHFVEGVGALLAPCLPAHTAGRRPSCMRPLPNQTRPESTSKFAAGAPRRYQPTAGVIRAVATVAQNATYAQINSLAFLPFMDSCLVRTRPYSSIRAL